MNSSMVASSARDFARASGFYDGEQDGDGQVRVIAGLLRVEVLLEQANVFQYCPLFRPFEGWIRISNARIPFARISSTS